jgi:hypothetical protein
MSGKAKTVHVPIVEGAPSLAQRLESIMEDVVLIYCATNRIAEQNSDFVDYVDVAEAAASATIRVREEVYWLQQLPDSVLAIDAPDTDQQEAADRDLEQEGGGAK